MIASDTIEVAGAPSTGVDCSVTRSPQRFHRLAESTRRACSRPVRQEPLTASVLALGLLGRCSSGPSGRTRRDSVGCGHAGHWRCGCHSRRSGGSVHAARVAHAAVRSRTVAPGGTAESRFSTAARAGAATAGTRAGFGSESEPTAGERRHATSARPCSTLQFRPQTCARCAFATRVPSSPRSPVTRRSRQWGCSGTRPRRFASCSLRRTRYVKLAWRWCDRTFWWLMT